MIASISQVLAAQCFTDAVTLIDGTADGFLTHTTDLQELPQHRLCLLELSMRRRWRSDSGQLEHTQGVAGDHHADGLVGGLGVKEKEQPNFIAEQDEDEVLAMGDE